MPLWRHRAVIPAPLNRESRVQSSLPRINFRILSTDSVPFPDLGVLTLLHAAFPKGWRPPKLPPGALQSTCCHPGSPHLDAQKSSLRHVPRVLAQPLQPDHLGFHQHFHPEVQPATSSSWLLVSPSPNTAPITASTLVPPLVLSKPQHPSSVPNSHTPALTLPDTPSTGSPVLGAWSYFLCPRRKSLLSCQPSPGVWG